jgi:hypothetical protein
MDLRATVMDWLRRVWGRRPPPQAPEPKADQPRKGEPKRKRRSWEDLPFTQWAEISRTDRGISIEPLSGYSFVQRDDVGFVIYLAPDADDEALGRALFETLDKSRFIWPRDEPEFLEADRYMRCYRNWQKDFMRRYGYKTKREAHRNMDWCRAERSEGKISIQPHKRNKPEYWTDLPPDRTVVIPTTTGAAVAGAALRLALNRCE